MDWDECATSWESDDGPRAYARAAFDSLLAEVDRRGFDLAGSRVCDFGCGTGLLTERLADSCAHIDAVDTSSAMLEVARAKIDRHGWTQVRALRELPGTGARYDLIVCSSVCGFVDDYAATASRLVARLQPGGLFVQWDWEADPDDAEPHGLTREVIRQTLTGVGLTSVTVDTGFAVSVGDQVMNPLMGCGDRPDPVR